MVQRLREAQVPDDQIIQVTGHRSVNTLAVYDTNKLSKKCHQKCQNVLQRSVSSSALGANQVSNLSAAALGAASVDVDMSVMPAVSTVVTTLSSQSVSHVAIRPSGFGVHSMFSGASFSNCVFHIGEKSEMTE